jgi:hypothetical protein
VRRTEKVSSFFFFFFFFFFPSSFFKGPSTGRRASIGSSQFSDLEFIKGQPIASSSGITIVVDLWSASSSKCQVSIPILSKLQERFKRVLFLGVTQDKLERAKGFVKEMGDNMSYRY